MIALFAPESPAAVAQKHSGSDQVCSPFRRWIILGMVSVFLAFAIGIPIADGDSVTDLIGSAGSTLRRAGQLPWRAAPALVAICGFHYAAAAVALRSAADLKLPLSRISQVQLAAAAANRITPAGLGGAAVNVRFLRRTGQTLCKSVASIGILSALGAVADLVMFAILVLAGRWVGLSGGSHELAALAAKFRGPVAMVWQLPIFLRLALTVLVGLGGGLGVARARQRRKAARGEDRSADAGQSPWSILSELLRQPRRLAVLLGASAATTLLLALGFAFTAQLAVVPASVSFGSLVVGYLIGGAVGGAVPIPAGVGATEAALVAVLVAGHMPLASAISCVLLFRVVTFWTPALAGLFVVKRLRRLQVL